MGSSPRSFRASLESLAFSAFWFVALPAGLVVVLLRWCEDPGVGGRALAELVREQRVPVGILVFTLLEMLFYQFRYWLPFAARVTSLGPVGLPRALREEVQHARHFVEQAERLLEHRRAQSLPAERRTELTRALSQLRAESARQPLAAEGFAAALARARLLADEHLRGVGKSEGRRTLESLLLAALFALALRGFVFEAFRIPSGSMLPTLQIGDHIFVNKLRYGPIVPGMGVRAFASLPPERGDVVVFEFPDEDPLSERQDFVKRVIALPGDTLEAEHGHPIINGWAVPYCRAGRYQYGENDGRPFEWAELDVEFLGEIAYLTLYSEDVDSAHEGPFQVPPGEVYVMGDNRNDSLDSRRWRHGAGAGVPDANLRGRASRVWLPISRLMLPIMGPPELPEGVPPELVQGVRRCLDQRPPRTEPPEPGQEPLPHPLG